MTRAEWNHLDRIAAGLTEFYDRPESIEIRAKQLREYLDEIYSKNHKAWAQGNLQAARVRALRGTKP